MKNKLPVILLILLMILSVIPSLAEEQPIPQPGQAVLWYDADAMSAPATDSEVVFHLYQGTRVPVLSIIDNEWAEITLGNQTCYLDAGALSYGITGIRQVTPLQVIAVPENSCKLYRSFSVPSQAIAGINESVLLLGENDEWYYTTSSIYSTMTGFLRKDEAGEVLISYDVAPFIFTEPADGEVTPADAEAFARKIYPEDDPYGEGSETIRSELEACTAGFEYLYYPGEETPLQYIVTFFHSDGTYYGCVTLYVEGDSIVSYAWPNG